MSKTEPDRYDEQAAELLPCIEDEQCNDVRHSVLCPARRRGFVVTALREAASQGFFGGSGGTCGVCGFQYREYNGHIIPCPRCRAAVLEQRERELRETLIVIRDRDAENCGCEHSDENCCAVAIGKDGSPFCAHCWAGQALAAKESE